MKFEQFSLALIELTQSVGTELFYPKLKDVFESTLYFDELLVLQLNKVADAQLYYRYGVDGIENRLQGEDAWKYLTRLYVLDPFYRIFADKNKFGFYALDEIAPDEFSNIYNSYFNFLKLSDEVGFLFPIDDDNCLHIDLSRFGENSRFSDQEKDSLNQLFLPLQNLCIKHISIASDINEATSSNVEEVLVNFGREMLTKKEYHVCQLLLQGHSTKAIGNIMEIGYETVKMHKKNIYGKTFLSSQSELLALFIEILQQDALDKDIDHLSVYMKQL